jgi:endonuclease/exonuclease/phosphatase family metal-dependent hydrolase
MPDSAPHRWRVLTWNVHGSADPDLAPIAAAIAQAHPDVACLQEVRRRQARRLARKLGWKWRWGRKHYPYSPLAWWTAEGHAILSPAPIAHLERITVSPGVSTWTYRHRIVLAATVTHARSAVRVYCTHLSSTSADERIAQARRVAELILEDRPPLAVVAGDLNSHGEEFVEVLREFRAVGLIDPGGDATSPAVAPVQRIDHVLVPEASSVGASDVPDGGEPWAAMSDHLPAVVEFTVS